VGGVESVAEADDDEEGSDDEECVVRDYLGYQVCANVDNVSVLHNILGLLRPPIEPRADDPLDLKVIDEHDEKQLPLRCWSIVPYHTFGHYVEEPEERVLQHLDVLCDQHPPEATLPS